MPGPWVAVVALCRGWPVDDLKLIAGGKKKGPKKPDTASRARVHKNGTKEYPKTLEGVLKALAHGLTKTEAAEVTGYNRAHIYDMAGQHPEAFAKAEQSGRVRVDDVVQTRLVKIVEKGRDDNAATGASKVLLQRHGLLTQKHEVAHGWVPLTETGRAKDIFGEDEEPTNG